MANLTIRKVTLGASTEEAYQFATQLCFSTGLLVSVCRDPILVKKSTTFEMPPNFSMPGLGSFEPDIFKQLTIIDCEPFHHGILSVNTEFTIIKLQAIASSDEEKNNKLCPQPLYVSDFISLANQISDRSTSDLSINFESKHFETVAISYDHQWNKISRPFTIFEGLVNMHSTVWVSKSFALKHNLFDGCLLELSKIYNKSGVVSKVCQNGSIQPTSGRDEKNRHRDRNHVVCVQISNRKDMSNDCVYTSPVCLFNCLKETKAKYSSSVKINLKKFQGLPDADIESSSSSSWFCQPPFTTELHVSCIHSPNYSAGTDFSKILQSYFSVTRFLCKDDVIAIDTKNQPEYWQSLSDGTEERQPTIYFKVTKLLPKIKGISTYRADSAHTNLFLESPVNSFVPSVMSIWPASVPCPGLEAEVYQLTDWLMPAIKSRRDARVNGSVLVSGLPGCGKSSIVRYAAKMLNMHCLQVNCNLLCGETSSATEARIKNVLGRGAALSPCLVLLQNPESLGKESDGSDDPRVGGAFHQQIQSVCEEPSAFPVVVVATTSAPKALSTDMHQGFLHHLSVPVPNESRRHDMLRHLVTGIDIAADVDLRHISQRTAGMVLGDLSTLVMEAKTQALADIVQNSSHSSHGLSWREQEAVVDAGFSVRQRHFDEALDQLQAAHSDTIGAPKIPSVSWADVGGLASVKADILDTVQLPLQHPELLAAGLRRSGVLLYGPPGTGKTLLAKAVATECALNFLSVKGPELINMYVGQSEENVREVFERARSASPCVIFFDELDSLAPNRGRSGDSGGVMDRVVSQLLAELDGLHSTADVFVIGATNRPDLLDPALLRPGRFDKLLYLGVSEDRDAQLHIITALTRKFTLAADCGLESVVERCPRNMTGADFYALCSDAMLNAMKRKIHQLEQGEEVDQTSVDVCFEDFTSALENLVPSVSEEELARYKSLQTFLTRKT